LEILNLTTSKKKHNQNIYFNNLKYSIFHQKQNPKNRSLLLRFFDFIYKMVDLEKMLQGYK